MSDIHHEGVSATLTEQLRARAQRGGRAGTEKIADEAHRTAGRNRAVPA